MGALLACRVAAGAAELGLPAVISDDMVLQCGQPAPIWGWAEPGEKVTVTSAGTMATAQTGEDGRWPVRPAALEAQHQAFKMVVGGSSGGVLCVKNVVVGEVWLCRGLSNIIWPATAKIEADIVVVQSDRVDQPVALRFAWGNTDVPNLCNGEGFLASLFRTDASHSKEPAVQWLQSSREIGGNRGYSTRAGSSFTDAATMRTMWR